MFELKDRIIAFCQEEKIHQASDGIIKQTQHHINEHSPFDIKM